MRLFSLTLLLSLSLACAAAAQSRLEAIRNIETDRGSILQQRQVVTVPFYQVYHAADVTGSPPSVTVTPFAPIALCGIDAPFRSDEGSVRLRFFVDHNPNAVLLPPTIDDNPFVCEIRIMNVQLSGGWELVELQDITSSCTEEGGSAEINRPFSDLSNLTHDVTLTVTGRLAVPGGCRITIRNAVLSGPFGQTWNNAFN